MVPVNAINRPTHAIAGNISFKNKRAPNAVHIGTVAMIRATLAEVVRETAIKNKY